MLQKHFNSLWKQYGGFRGSYYRVEKQWLLTLLDQIAYLVRKMPTFRHLR